MRPLIEDGTRLVSAARQPHSAHRHFGNYWLGDAYDEMFDAGGATRDPYAALLHRLQGLELTELQQRQSAAEQAFLNQGITFTVYGQQDGTERIFPYDLIPRLITAAEWQVLERGLTQRITALNLFLKDLYASARILADGVVPRELVYSCKHFRRACRCVTTSTSRSPAPTWCGCRTGPSRCSKTTCACQAASATC
jgi:uncharacterized circularly permuted ATP-grasp superfamily protein